MDQLRELLLNEDSELAREFAAKAMFEEWRASPDGAGSRHLEWSDLTGYLQTSRIYWLAKTIPFWPVLTALRSLAATDVQS